MLDTNGQADQGYKGLQGQTVDCVRSDEHIGFWRIRMPYGYSKRIYKKKYKMALERIVLKITKAYNDKHDRKIWISKVANCHMRGLKKKRN